MNRLALRVSGQGLVLDDDLDCAILISSFQDHDICKAIWIPIKPFFDVYKLTSSKGGGPIRAGQTRDAMSLRECREIRPTMRAKPA